LGFAPAKNMKTRMTKSITTLVGADTSIAGNLLFGRGCHVAGLVQGDVMGKDDGKAELTMAQSGRIEGNARALRMLIEGTVVGDLFCAGTVSLGASARVEGSIEYEKIEIEKGAVVTGLLRRKGADAVAQAAVEPDDSAELAGAAQAQALPG